VSSPAGRLTIRTFADSDEKAIAHLFNSYLARFVGPAPVTPESWRQQYDVSWRTPVLKEDPECFRVAERGGEVVGYAVTDSPSRTERDVAVIQELCVAEVEGADEIARALVEDAEERARARGVPAMVVDLSPDDGLACRTAAAAGYETLGEVTEVFMATITNFAAFLEEMESELTRRFAASQVCQWEGGVHLRSGEMAAGLRLEARAVHAEPPRGEAALSVDITPEALQLLLFGQVSVREAFLQNWLSVAASDQVAALQVLAALFPCLPMYLPRSQWW